LLARFSPQTIFSPYVGESIPEIIFSKVVFPLPDGPRITTNSPFLISKLTPLRTLNATDLLA
jgi:hypothetical protein